MNVAMVSILKYWQWKNKGWGHRSNKYITAQTQNSLQQRSWCINTIFRLDRNNESGMPSQKGLSCGDIYYPTHPVVCGIIKS